MQLVLLIVGILVSSGFFSGAEAALLSVTDAEVEDMSHRGKKGWKILKKIKSDINRSMIAIVIMNNVVNIVGSILVGQMVIALFGNALLAVTTTALTFGVIVFSEILPKSLGIHYAPSIAPAVAPVIWVITLLFYPLIVVLEILTNALKRGERHIGTEAQIRALVKIGHRAGHIESDEGQLIHRAFILNDKTAADVMTPLKDIIGIQSDSTIREAAEKVFLSTHSRYPVFGNSIHDVVGIVMSHNILELLAEGKDDMPVMEILRDALVVDVHDRSDRLLILFRDRHIHLAVVQDQGKTVGLVTLEDVLEELVGEIEDETDVEEN